MSGRKHGMTHTRLFKTWIDMKQRCSNKNTTYYFNYGGRGISVCDEWSEFLPFYKWAINNGYSDSLSIDRIDNDGNYGPSNCKFSTRIEQQNNTRHNVWCEYNGQIRNMKQWSKLSNIPYKTLADRLHRYGWTIEKALLTPVRIQKNNVQKENNK